jgi:pyruvate/2-oxoglutarate dehydrogenase complex dihydrolipoamide acyltransferase (E2) component
MESVIEFKLPALGENIEQGDLVRLMIAPGATVSEGQAVMELETDKAVVEVPSSVSGTINQILVKEGDKIKVGQVIFTADSNGAAAEAKETPRRKEPAKLVEKAQPVQSSSGASSGTNRGGCEAAAGSSIAIRIAASARTNPARPTTGRRPASFACRNSEKTSQRAIWCA